MSWLGRTGAQFVCLLGTAFAAAPASAEPPQGADRTPQADGGVHESLRVTPRLLETGRIGEMRVGDPWRVSSAQPLQTDADVMVRTIAPRERDRQIGTIDAEVLRSEVGRLFDRLRTCRIEVARIARIAPAQVVTGELDLRWIIRRDGTADELAVVTNAPTDPRLIDCVRRSVLHAQFTSPTGGIVPVNYRFAFSR